MAEFIHNEEQFVNVGEPIVFENKTECSFSADVGVIFRKSGIYKVSIVKNRISISEITTLNALERKCGEWVTVKGSNGKDYRKCTNCLHTQEITGLLNYCPICGADMRNKEDE